MSNVQYRKEDSKPSRKSVDASHIREVPGDAPVSKKHVTHAREMIQLDVDR